MTSSSPALSSPTPRAAGAALVCALIALVAVMSGCRERAPELYDLGTVPHFTLTDASGQTFDSKTALAGRPWAVNFLFTSCTSACPELAESSAKLQAAMLPWAFPEGAGPDAPARGRILSISVDPIVDTPERLTTFGAKYSADARLWHLLRTEDYDAMAALVTKGFMQPIIRSDLYRARNPEEAKYAKKNPTPIDTAHSVRFVLVDGNMTIRGLYDRDDEGIKQLNHAMRYLAEHPDAPSIQP